MRILRSLAGLLLHYGMPFFLSTFIIFLLLNSAPQETDSFGFENLNLRDANIAVRYAAVLWQVVNLDLGYFEGIPAKAKILFGLISTFSLLLAALVFVTISALGLGLIFTYQRESRFFRFLHLLTDFTSLLPAYILGYFVSVLLVSQAGLTTDMEFARQHGKLLLLAMFGLAAILLGVGDGTLTELIRQLLAELAKGRQARHIQAVRANNLNLLRHMLRAALVPLLVALNLRLVHLMGAVIVVEKIFTIKGLGLLTLEGIERHNYLIVFAVSAILVAAVLVIHGINSLILSRLNPLAEAGEGDETHV